MKAIFAIELTVTDEDGKTTAVHTCILKNQDIPEGYPKKGFVFFVHLKPEWNPIELVTEAAFYFINSKNGAYMYIQMQGVSVTEDSDSVDLEILNAPAWECSALRRHRK